MMLTILLILLAVVFVLSALANAYVAYCIFRGDNVLTHRQIRFYPIGMAVASACLVLAAVLVLTL
ncbi:MAG: hypothetical protein PF501_08535 [Salinisphaera sp.]|jgi:hypothetical protein|nr:hypothetical protein [Salinisphaera sp.]